MCGLSVSMANKQTTALIRHMGAGEQTNARLWRTELLQSVPCQPIRQKQEPRQTLYEVKYNNKVFLFQTVPPSTVVAHRLEPKQGSEKKFIS